MKTLMGKVLVESNKTYNEIILQLDDVQLKIKLVDHKINFFTKKLTGLDFIRLNFSQPQVPVVDDHVLNA
jgi:hypothetical protein